MSSVLLFVNETSFLNRIFSKESYSAYELKLWEEVF